MKRTKKRRLGAGRTATASADLISKRPRNEFRKWAENEGKLRFLQKP
jgi:hypothetical protein